MRKPDDREIREEVRTHIDDTQEGDNSTLYTVAYQGQDDSAFYYLALWETEKSGGGGKLLKLFYYVKPKPGSWRDAATMMSNGISMRLVGDDGEQAQLLAQAFARTSNQQSGGIEGNPEPLYLGVDDGEQGD